MKIDAKKMEMKIFLGSFFTAFLLGTQAYALRQAQISAAKTKKKTKKRFLSCVWRFGNEKNHRWKKKRAEKETKEKRERTTRHTIFERFLNFFFFLPTKKDRWKKKATDINVAIFFRFEDWLDSLLLLDVF